jgi:hypothetical protein
MRILSTVLFASIFIVACSKESDSDSHVSEYYQEQGHADIHFAPVNVGLSAYYSHGNASKDVSSILNNISALKSPSSGHVSRTQVSRDQGHRIEPSSQVNTQAIPDVKIVRNASIQILSTDIHQTRAQLDSMVFLKNGSYSRDQFSESSNTLSYHLTIQIPAHHFDDFMQSYTPSSARVTSKTVSMRDVTMEYTDHELRIENTNSYIARFRELLAKAKTITEILEIENRISQLTYEQEQAKVRLRYLAAQVEMSNIQIQINQRVQQVFIPKERDSFLTHILKSLETGWNSVLSIVLWIIRWWPVIIALTIVFYMFKRKFKKK